MTTVSEGLNITNERKKEILELLQTIRENTDTKSEMLQEIMKYVGLSDEEKAYMIFHYSSKTDVKALATAVSGFLQANDATPEDAIAVCELVKAGALISTLMPSSIEVIGMGGKGIEGMPPELKDLFRKLKRDMR